MLLKIKFTFSLVIIMNKKINSKKGCFKKALYIGALSLGTIYLANKCSSKNNYVPIEENISNIEFNERSSVISNYINKDSIDISSLVNNLNEDKKTYFLNEITNNLSEKEKSDYIIDIYNDLSRKKKFQTVKEITKNSIGFSND